MKTTKLVMITALVSFALMSFANAELGMSKNVISLKAAVHNPQLVNAIYNQVNPTDILNIERFGTYTVSVVLKKTVYLINGTFKEWKMFFRDVDVKSPLCNAQKNPDSFIESNPFGISGHGVSPSIESDPGGIKLKKHPSKKIINVFKGDL